MSMKFTPAASTRTSACPWPGFGTSTSANFITSGPPVFSMRIARAIPTLRDLRRRILLRPRVRLWDGESQEWPRPIRKNSAAGRKTRRGADARRVARTSLKGPRMETLLADLRYALRTLGRSPGFTLAAALALALGIGGSTAIFSVLDGVVLRPLAAPRSDDLVRLYEVPPDNDHVTYSTGDYLEVVHEAKSFESVGAVWPARMSITLESGPTRIPSSYVTASFFSTLKVFPALGRALSPEEDLKGARSVVITDQLWKREF